MIDCHIHLDADQYADRAGLIKRARETGVGAIVAPGTGPGSNEKVLALAREYPGFVHAAIGFHPERYDLTDADVDATLAILAREHDSICAVGEVGLPWYGDRASDPNTRERARAILIRFAQSAHELDLALILHAPHQSAAKALKIIRQAKVQRAVFHWHKSDDATTRAIIDAGYFISLTPEVAYRDRDQALARLVPLESMLVETDGPWPYKGPFAGEATEPGMIARAIAAIARIKNTSSETVARATTDNAARLFGIEWK